MGGVDQDKELGERLALETGGRKRETGTESWHGRRLGAGRWGKEDWDPGRWGLGLAGNQCVEERRCEGRLI